MTWCSPRTAAATIPAGRAAARHLDHTGATLVVEDLSWTGGAGAGSADEIAEVLADQDRVDAGRGAVFRIHHDDGS